MNRTNIKYTEDAIQSFLDYYGEINKKTLTTFLGITEKEYYALRAKIKKQYRGWRLLYR